MGCVPGHPVFTDWCGHGRLIVASPPSGRDDLEEHLITQQAPLGFRHLYSMATYLTDRGISLPPVFTKAFLYRSLGNPGVIARINNIEPDQQLNFSAPQVRIGTSFSLTAGQSSHATYKFHLKAVNPTTNMGGKSVAVDGTGIQIAIIDTGLEAGKPAPASYSDFVVPNTPQDDVDGHGTAMSEIIKDIAPGAKLHIYRVTHSTTVFVLDMMAAVSAAVYNKNVDFVSLSMGCKDLSYPCKLCGGHGQNRSAVCQQFFDLIDKNPSSRQTIVVASVGNDGQQDPFEWPAVYDNVLAVGSINKANIVSSFSNSATRTSSTNFCPLPGGDETSRSTEYVGEGQDGGNVTYCFGTSPATAYAAGILALRKHHEHQNGLHRNRTQFLKQLSVTAKQTVMDASNNNIYDPLKHGMGRLDYSP
jgi:hypothetical protein